MSIAERKERQRAERYELIVAAARELAEAELGAALSTRYAWIDETPLAAASLGQVHRAKLCATEIELNGFEDVVVKVQRPYIEQVVEVDLAALRRVGGWLQRYKPVSKRADVRALVEEFAATTPEPPAASLRPLWSSWWVQAPLLAFLVVAWYVAGFAAGRQIDKVVPRAAPPPRDPYAISLTVLQYGDNLHLTWDRQARPIAVAERGSLLISDAGQSRTLDLTREQLRNGAVAYHQIGERVQLRLEVSLPGRRTVSETWESPATGR